MNIHSFSWGYTWRVLALCSATALAAFIAFRWQLPWAGFFVALVALALAVNLLRYVNDTNRRLTRFFESVRYSDFAVRFSSNREKGDSFAAVNQQFNEVLEAFRQTRAEKEANLLFLNTIVQHLSAGLIAFDAHEQVLLSNNAALQLLNVYRLHQLSDLPERHVALRQFVADFSGRGKMLYQSEPGRQLSVQGVQLNLQGKPVKLLTLQNIHPELQRKEVDAWRNLTRVLRHEIMNSVTPIVSLVETMQLILRDDLKNQPNVPAAAVGDLEEALDVVAFRSRSLMDFVEAYRSFSAIPQPRPEQFFVKKLLDRVVQLGQPNLRERGVRIEITVTPEDLSLHADPGQIEMVLLNLIRNACEAFSGQEPAPHIILNAGIDNKNKTFIEVEDNGPGIEPELLEEIFIPFFTTKQTGTGVGLSISRQILQMHGGDIRVSSSTGNGAKFVLDF